jgi:hypothetical protein
MQAIRWAALLCGASLVVASCGGGENRSSALRLRNSAVNCFATESERSAALENAKSTRDAAVADLASKGDESALSTALSDANQKYESAKSKYEETQARINSLRESYFAGIGAGHNQTNSPEYQNWMVVVRNLNAGYAEEKSLRPAMISSFQVAQSAQLTLTNWQSAKNAADRAGQQLATTETTPICEAAETSSTSESDVSSTSSSVVDVSSTTSEVDSSSTTSVVDVSSTTSQPETETSVSVESSTTTSVAPVTSDSVTCEISDITAPSQVVVGDEFEVSARFTGAGCVNGPPNPWGVVRVGMAFSGDLLLQNNGCSSGNCEGVVSYRFRAREIGGSVVYPRFRSGDVNLQQQVTIDVVSAQSTTTSTVAKDEKAKDEAAETSTSVAASDPASCKYSKPTAPSQVVVGEPFDFTIDSSSEDCSDRLILVASGFDGEVRTTAILSGQKVTTFSMMIMGPGLVTFQMYHRAPTGDQKLAELQVASVEPAKKSDVDPCGELGVDEPNFLDTSEGLEVSAACAAAERLNVQIRTRQGSLVFETYTVTSLRIINAFLDLFLQDYGSVVVTARHVCLNRASCGVPRAQLFERSTSDEETATTTTTSISKSTTTTSTSVAAPSTESTVAAATTTTSVAPTTTTTSSVPELVTPTVESPTGQPASTAIPVGLFGSTTEGSAATTPEVTKIAVDEAAVILICDQTCIDDVAAQTGADPQDPTAIEVSVDGGAWQPALGSIVPIVNGRATLQFRGTPPSGAPVILGAELFTNDTPLENVSTIDPEGNVTNASGEVVAQVPVYDVVESGFSLAWWMWLLAGLAALVLLFLLSLFWRKRMSALTDNHSTGDRPEQK